MCERVSESIDHELVACHGQSETETRLAAAALAAVGGCEQPCYFGATGQCISCGYRTRQTICKELQCLRGQYNTHSTTLMGRWWTTAKQVVRCPDVKLLGGCSECCWTYCLMLSLTAHSHADHIFGESCMHGITASQCCLFLTITSNCPMQPCF